MACRWPWRFWLEPAAGACPIDRLGLDGPATKRYRWGEEKVNKQLQQTMRSAWSTVCEVAQQEDVDYRLAAFLIAARRVREAIQLRGF